MVDDSQNSPLTCIVQTCAKQALGFLCRALGFLCIADGRLFSQWRANPAPLFLLRNLLSQLQWRLSSKLQWRAGPAPASAAVGDPLWRMTNWSTCRSKGHAPHCQIVPVKVRPLCCCSVEKRIVVGVGIRKPRVH
eukprot:1157328-Pelagomonas_calceolata.AAC.11